MRSRGGGVVDSSELPVAVGAPFHLLAYLIHLRCGQHFTNHLNLYISCEKATGLKRTREEEARGGLACHQKRFKISSTKWDM